MKPGSLGVLAGVGGYGIRFANHLLRTPQLEDFQPGQYPFFLMLLMGRALQANVANVKTHFLYDPPLDDDLASGRCDRVGVICKRLANSKFVY
jgi:hypothetical protein